MKIHLHIPYTTNFGESLCAVLFAQTPHTSQRRIVQLTTTDGVQWTGDTELQIAEQATLTYAYYLLRDGKIIRREWNVCPRQIQLQATQQEYHFHDLWQELPEQSWLYTAPFTQKHPQSPLPAFASMVLLRVFIPGLTDEQIPLLCGESEALGNWNPQQALPLCPVGNHLWGVALDAATLATQTQFKIILRQADGSILWEQNANRILPVHHQLPPGQTAVYQLFVPTFDLPPVRLAGTVLPVFSIRTENDWGIGDFGSIKSLVDWAAATGQKMIQILPVNDTSLTGTWQDSYPYNSVSVYALHPIYADMSALPPLPDAQAKKFEKRRAKLNELPQLDYEEVLKLKLERLHLAYEAEGLAVIRGQAFQKFWNENAHWLPAYAMFSALRDQYGSCDWQHWETYSQFSENSMRRFFLTASPAREQAYFYFYVQFVLHNHLLSAHEYARSKGISLKGDIPIGVSPYSADAWAAPELFHLNAQAGAPPDDFSVTGQNWGFPTYNWDRMAQDGYTWWKQRFTHMTRYFDAYRIDHVLGFFRIWEIPLHAVQGLLGQFSPALALSEDEIRQFGFDFQPAHLRPYISDEILQNLFADQADEVRRQYLLETNVGYQLHDRYNTQRKIEKFFEGKTEENQLAMRDGLYALCANVLFVADHRNPQLYHPRISALNTTAFQALSKQQQQAYTQLYNEYFYHRQDEFWKEQALQKLPALTQSTAMLCCAEDLGMIPNCVPEVMSKLQMLSLEIQRMPKQMGVSFAQPEHYPYLSVATPSTHDMSVIRGWWKENAELSGRFWTEVLGRQAPAPAELPGEACEQILRQHLQSPSMLCMIGWQDWTSMDESFRAPHADAERINIPANPRHYWRYRMHITLEELAQRLDFNEKLKNLIQQAHR